MSKYDFVLFAMVAINMIFSFINLIVVDAAMQEYDRRRKKEDERKQENLEANR